MKREGPCAVYCVALLVLVVVVENTLALTGPPGSVCGSQCCDGWDQVEDTCVHCFYPCIHGTCVDTNVCECEPGWEGGDCRYDVDECWYETHACHHNCHNNDGCYTCSCDDGFHLINSTHCVSSPTSDISSTPAGLPQGATEIPTHCVTATTTTVGRVTAQTTHRITDTTASGLRTTPTHSIGDDTSPAVTTTVSRVTTNRPRRTTNAKASSLRTDSTATSSGFHTRSTATTTVERTTTNSPQRTTNTQASSLNTNFATTTATADLTATTTAQRTTRVTSRGSHTRSTATQTVDRTTTNPPQTTTETADTSFTVTTTASVTTLRTTRANGAAGRPLTHPVHDNSMAPPVTTPVTYDNGRSPAPHGGRDHQNVSLVIGVAGGAVSLLFISIALLIFCARRKKPSETAARQQFANLPQQPRGSLPGYSDTHWRNPAFDNLYEEIPELRSPPPPYEAAGGHQASDGFTAVAEMPSCGLTDTKSVGVSDVGISLAGATPVLQNGKNENLSSTLCNLHVDMQKAPPQQDDGYEPLKKVPGNEYESLKRW
ncbi:PREDICTED: hyphal wall protein 1-like [Branchiostoma belcheri]|uniref:Hyphal wall protein 1-like n=1 Tax=Branchiostoma belcheri TaxID=7741 RepID=A0A6P4YIK8_BRABE|nr:PREDICTED: hyphal wall protein 1-like [Branchiostoma belcheri]XP_019616861.1 PREDICTED: hyphal wall protein 1-like [Branchiostoma belcheri]